MKLNLDKTLNSINFPLIDKFLLSMNGLNTAVKIADEPTTVSSLTNYKSYLFFVNISIALINLINVTYSNPVSLTSSTLLTSLHEISYVILLATMKMTIIGYNQLVDSIALSITLQQSSRLTKVRCFLLTFLVSFFSYRIINLLIGFEWSPFDLSTLGHLTLALHSILISNSLILYSAYLYTIAIYSAHQLCVTFMDRVTKVMNSSHHPSTYDICSLRSYRFQYQAIKQFLDKTTNWWSIVWYTDAFITSCLILVNLFYPITSSDQNLIRNSWFISVIRISSLFCITLLADYVTNYEVQITYYIGDHLAPRLDDSLEIKLEYIKLSQELGARPFIPYTLADMFNINRNLILSFFSAVLPLSVITLNFIKESYQSNKSS